MHTVIQATISGLSVGAVYALMASGLTLVFGVMRVINVAQGILAILAAYLSYTLFGWFGVDPFISILLLVPLLFGIGIALHGVFLRPLPDQDDEMSLLVTFGIALGLEGVLAVAYRSTYRSTQTGYADTMLRFGGYSISLVRLLAFGLCIVVLGGLFVLLRRTKFGRSVRATAQNPMSARLLGVDVSRVRAFGFGLGAATAAVAGAVYGLVFPFNPSSHYDLIGRLLTIIVLGGMGSLGGAIVAALGMGVIEALVAATIAPVWAPFAFFVVLIGVLLFRPRGLFGVTVREAT